jgi:hypothetical protein
LSHELVISPHRFTVKDKMYDVEDADWSHGDLEDMLEKSKFKILGKFEFEQENQDQKDQL